MCFECEVGKPPSDQVNVSNLAERHTLKALPRYRKAHKFTQGWKSFVKNAERFV